MTTYEVELKLRTAHEPVREQLAALDAEPLGRVEQTDTYYDAPDRDFAETDEALRIRRERDDGEIVRLTYKGPLVDDRSKTREEAETTVGDRETADVILRGLGYEPAATVEKERERFALDGFTVTLDTVTGLGEFVEVDREVSGDQLEAARDDAEQLLQRLDLDPTSGIQTSYLGLLLAEE